MSADDRATSVLEIAVWPVPKVRRRRLWEVIVEMRNMVSEL